MQKNIQSWSIELDEFSQREHICETNTQIKKHNIITVPWTPSLRPSTLPRGNHYPDSFELDISGSYRMTLWSLASFSQPDTMNFIHVVGV